MWLWLILGSLLPSMFVAWAAAFCVRRFGPAWGLIDSPGHRKVHASPMPTCGGLAIWLGIILPFAAGQIALASVSVPARRPGSAGCPARFPSTCPA